LTGVGPAINSRSIYRTQTYDSSLRMQFYWWRAVRVPNLIRLDTTASTLAVLQDTTALRRGVIDRSRDLELEEK
jgi:hypothetical protein